MQRVFDVAREVAGRFIRFCFRRDGLHTIRLADTAPMHRAHYSAGQGAAVTAAPKNVKRHYAATDQKREASGSSGWNAAQAVTASEPSMLVRSAITSTSDLIMMADRANEPMMVAAISGVSSA